MGDAPAAGPVVLLVDDDPAIRRAVGAGLELEGFTVVPASGGRAALEAAARVHPAVVLLDLDDARPRRARGPAAPARGRRRGAGLRPVGARRGRRPRRRPPGRRRRLRRQAVRAGGGRRAAARAAAPPPGRRRRGADGGRHPPRPARPHGAPRRRARSELTRREFDLLQLFLRHPGEVLDRARLHEEVWGYTFDPGTNVADVFVGYLRRKLEAGRRAAGAAHGPRRRLRPASVTGWTACAQPPRSPDARRPGGPRRGAGRRGRCSHSTRSTAPSAPRSTTGSSAPPSCRGATAVAAVQQEVPARRPPARRRAARDRQLAAAAARGARRCSTRAPRRPQHRPLPRGLLDLHAPTAGATAPTSRR